MNQKVLYSMMGLAALPLGAEAAVVQAAQLTNWEGTGLTVVDGTISSNGSAAEYTIPQLLPGNYKLTCSLTTKVYNVTVEIGGTKKEITNASGAQAVELEFTLTETKDVKLSFTSSDPGEAGSAYSFTAPVLSLDFDFNNAKTTLAGRANALKTVNIPVYEYNSTDDAKAVDDLVEKINTTIEEKYLTYKDKKLYNLDSKKTAYDDDIANLAATIAANQNEQAYSDVNAEITATKAKYNAAVTELEGVLVDAAGYLLNGAKAKLNEEINKKITEATSASYASYEAGTAVADKTANLGKIPTETALNTIVDDYKTQAQNNKAKYQALADKVTALEGALSAVTYADNNDAISAAFATERAAASEAINKVKAKVEAVYNKAEQLSLNDNADFTTDYNNANSKITTLAGKVSTANAEFNANKATTAAIAVVQKAKDDAVTDVNKKNSKDGEYKPADYYADYLKTQQDAINKLTTDAAAAYKADGTGTAQNYNNGLAAKTAPITAAINDYKTNAPLAVENYDKRQDDIAEYQDTLNKVRAKIKGLDIYTAADYDYETKLDLLQKRINEIKKAIAAAQEKRGAEHWTAMQAVAADDKFIQDVTDLIAGAKANQNQYDKDQLTADRDSIQRSIDDLEATDAVLGADYQIFAIAKATIDSKLVQINSDWEAIDVNAENAPETIQALGERITSLKAEQAALVAAADAVKAKVAANTNAKTTLAASINGLQTSIETFKTTYKVGEDDSTLGLRGKAGGSVTTEVNDIETKLGTLKTANDEVVPTAVDSVNITVAGNEYSNLANGVYEVVVDITAAAEGGKVKANATEAAGTATGEVTLAGVFVTDGTLKVSVNKEGVKVEVKKVTFHENDQLGKYNNASTETPGYNNQYTALNERFQAQNAAALGIKTAVENNAATLTAANTAVSNLQDAELNTLKNLENVTNNEAKSDDDTAKKTETEPANWNWKVFEDGLETDKTYTAKKKAIDDDIAAMSNAIKASAAVEKLFDEWKDNSITVGEGDNKKTYSISAITAAINALKAEAAAESDNWKAYKALKDSYWEKLQPDSITIVAADMGEGAMPHYQELKTQYIKDKADILKNMRDSLNARTAVSTKGSFEAEITDLINKVKAIYPDSKANKAKYDEQKAAYQHAQTLWNNTFTEIAARDKSSKVQEWTDQLDAIQVKLTEAKDSVEANYLIGKSVAEAKDFAAIEASINDVKAQWSEGYNEAITEDNAAAHASFNNAIGLANQAYLDAVNDRAKYSSTNAEIEGFITNAAADLDVALYNCPTDIETLRNEEGEAYVNTMSPDVFDVSGFNTRAAAIAQNITSKLNTFKTNVRTAIEGYWTPKKNGYADKVTEAEAAINSYKDEAKTNAFKDVTDLIANGDAGVQSMTLSEVEAAIDSLEYIDAMLTADKNDAAVKDIKLWIADAEDKYTEVKTYLESVSIADDVYGVSEQLSYLDNDYWYVTYIKNRPGTYNFSNRNDYVNNYLNRFITQANGIKKLVEDAVVSDAANTAAYDEMAAAIAPVGEKLDEAMDAAAPYKYATSFATEEEKLAGIETDADYYKTRGSAVANKTALLNRVTALSADIETTLTTAFGTEKTGLAADIAELKNQYNAYVAAKGLDDTANAFKAKIDEYEKALRNAAIADLDDPADGIQFDEIVAATENLIALQNNIANLESELLQANASTANADVLADFQTQLGELATSATLEGKADWVKQRMFNNGKTLEQWITEISAQIAELQEEVENEPNIAFFKKQYQEQITNIKTALDPVVNEINDRQAQFDANTAAYTKLSGQLQELQDLVDAAKAKVYAYTYASSTYKSRIEYYDYWGYLQSGVQYDINNAKEDLGDDNNDVTLTASSNLNTYINVNNTKSTIQGYLDDSAYAELTAQKNNLSTLLSDALDKAGHVGVHMYSSALWSDLMTTANAINTEITNLGKAINDSHVNHYYWNNNGVRTWGITSDADYASQMETVGNIKNEIEDLDDAVDNMGLLGDANTNGEVTVADYQIVLNMILGKNATPTEGTNLFANLDINKNSRIEVGDLTAIVNYILNKEWADDYAAVKGFRSQSESMSMDITPMQQGVQRYAINLQNTEDYTAFQLDVLLPEGMTIVGQSLSDRAGQSHKLYSHAQEDGSIRFLASSVKGETFSGNEGAVLYIDVQTDASFKGGSVEMLNILFSDIYANTHAFAIGNGGEATGIDIMAAMQSLKQKVYDLGGRMMNGMKKGVNIIQNADGTTKKVLK